MCVKESAFLPLLPSPRETLGSCLRLGFSPASLISSSPYPDTMKPIQTRAYGRLFRSRTEARWAVAFTEAQIEWQYELEGYHLPSGPYLPDFWLPQVKMWAEVKADCFSLEELHKAHDLANHTQWPVLLLSGQPADASYHAIHPDLSHYTAQDQLADGTPVKALDYAPFEGSDYHLSESRFYCCAGGPGEFPHPLPMDSFDVNPAIYVALSARFEHGQAPSR